MNNSADDRQPKEALEQDLLARNAILIRDHLCVISQSAEAREPLSLKEVAPVMERTCRACVEMGNYFVKSRGLGGFANVPEMFDKLVEHEVIDASLRRRLLSLICFSKLLKLRKSRGKYSLRIHLRPGHIRDFHTFSQQLLLA
jgi:uncharacterized protein YutE (UPF0331/DUF86 family)